MRTTSTLLLASLLLLAGCRSGPAKRRWIHLGSTEIAKQRTQWHRVYVRSSQRFERLQLRAYRGDATLEQVSAVLGPERERVDLRFGNWIKPGGRVTRGLKPPAQVHVVELLGYTHGSCTLEVYGLPPKEEPESPQSESPQSGGS
ncbi:MAG TPA: hypothetical protein DEA08_04510 [Planctomycetes bacterium]|nr:hypothetical protein [Planctomycetota bacterium]